MKFRGHKLSLTALLVILLPVLLIVLATLQYRWLGEISQAEQERMQQRLQTDARRFAQDFNAEITKAFFSFQFDTEDAENPAKYAEHLEVWRQQTAFPNLVGEIYLTKKQENGAQKLIRYNAQEKTFSSVDWSEDLQPLLARIKEQNENPAPSFARAIDSIEPKVPALLIPLFEHRGEIARGAGNFSVRTSGALENDFVIVRLDSNVIKNEIVPALAKQHFSDSDFAYAIFGKEQNDRAIFKSAENFDFTNADASANLFAVSPDSTNVFALASGLRRAPEKRESTTIFHSKMERTNSAPRREMRIEMLREPIVVRKESQTANVRILRNEKSENTIISRTDGESGNWQLKVSHADGSLENFVNKTRWHNLAVSFGILSLLGASVVLLFVSTHRAKRAAQRQLDFVSSVTHEFRTPIAVVCSAGDNLADGIVKTPAQIERYGELLRREGDRLSEMVEQILEFAGARARRKKYDLQPLAVRDLIETVLNDCQPLIEEKNFAVENRIAENLPEILADRAALKQSVQNLVNNALKYGGENRWLRISAAQNGNRVKISVEDKGIGIEPKEIRQIFEPFYRGQKAVAEQIHGNGLGLSLVKQIVEAHNGEIRVESKLNEGSCFSIEIPAISPNLETQNSRDAKFLKPETL